MWADLLLADGVCPGLDLKAILLIVTRKRRLEKR